MTIKEKEQAIIMDQKCEALLQIVLERLSVEYPTFKISKDIEDRIFLRIHGIAFCDGYAAAEEYAKTAKLNI